MGGRGTRSCLSIYCLSTDATADDDDADDGDDGDDDDHDDDDDSDADDDGDVNNDAGENDDDEDDEETHTVTQLPEPLAASIRCAGRVLAASDSRPDALQFTTNPNVLTTAILFVQPLLPRLR